MDETNYNIHISRAEGRSQKGTRCTTVAAGLRGSNIHSIGCISRNGLVFYETKRGSFRGDQACEWMRQCLRVCERKFEGHVIMEIDNASCHSQLESVFRETEFQGNVPLRLPPYGPMFNPMQNVWSVAKSVIKRQLAARTVEILRTPSNLSIRENRLRALEELIEEE
jgi:transposase